MTTRGKVIMLGGVLLVAGAGGVWSWRTHERATAIAAVMPPAPDLSEWPSELADRIVNARERAGAGSLDALGELSALYHANGYLAEARACYAILQQLQPDEPRWWHRDATILAGYGDTEAALTRAERVIALAPEYRPAQLRFGDLLLKRNDLARAAAVYEAILREEDNPHALLGLARIDVESGRWNEARARLERVVAQTGFELGYDLIVTVYERLGLRVQASAIRGRNKASGAYRDPEDPWVDELIEVCFDTYRLALVAGVAQRSEKWAAAERLLKRAVALAPDDAAVRFQLAGLLGEKGNLPRASEQLERCTRIAPDFADPWAHWAGLLEQAGDQAGAERVVETALTQCPTSPGLHLMRARQHQRAGRTEAAIAAFRRSITLRANEADAYVELAMLLLQTGRASEAGPLLQQAVEVEPDQPTALGLLALLAIAARDEAGANHWMQRVRAQPRLPVEQVRPIDVAYREAFGRAFP